MSNVEYGRSCACCRCCSLRSLRFDGGGILIVRGIVISSGRFCSVSTTTAPAPANAAAWSHPSSPGLSGSIGSSACPRAAALSGVGVLALPAASMDTITGVSDCPSHGPPTHRPSSLLKMAPCAQHSMCCCNVCRTGGGEFGAQGQMDEKGQG